MTGIDLRKLSRAERSALPVASEVLENMVAERGGCIRPVLLRRTDRATGEAELLPVPCGASLAAKCPACAKRKRSIRVQQCREGWHLAAEPEVPTEDLDEVQRWWVEQRSAVTTRRDRLAQQPDTDPDELAQLDDLIADLDEEITSSGMRGHVDRSPRDSSGSRRARSTRRREDAPDLPKRPKNRATIGRAYTDPKTGNTFRPSLFITMTLDSYGRVRSDGTPVDPSTYDYVRAARDAIHFPKLIDRFIQNLRRVAGFDVQYFATVEPQRRLAPHLHLATRGTIPRAEVRQVVAATYHHVWWPPTDRVLYEGERLPVWDEDSGDFIDPATGEVLPTWEQALDRLDDDAEPFHVIRAGRQVDVKGVAAGSDDADRCIRYLSKYLTKTIGECHDPDTPAQRDHAQRLLDALRFEPCSPQCSNWLRYGIQPQSAKAGMRPGYCTKKAHRPEHLGYAGRRVLVSRKWSGKTLTDHKRDRLAYVLDLLGTGSHDDEEDQDHGGGPPGRVSERVRQSPEDPYEWELARPGQPGVPTRHQLLMHQLTDTITRRQQLEEARNVTVGGAHSDQDPATNREAA